MIRVAQSEGGVSASKILQTAPTRHTRSLFNEFNTPRPTDCVQICGVDDAGRGSLLGPLVIAGVSATRPQIRRLSRMGVRDSKKISPSRRNELYGKIIASVEGYKVARIAPRIIDSHVRRHLLNKLEAKYMAKVISRIKPDVSYVDSCDVNPARFGKAISELAGSRVRSYHHADDRFVIVSAASIVAKVNRDRAIAKIHKIHEVGSGYPSDRKTINFVSSYYQDRGVMPNFVRISWSPARRIMGLD